jgi:hypothetical protein
MFPDLSDFKEFPWNCVLLTPREHYIAHLLLWKTYRNRAASYAFHIMIHGDTSNKRYKKVSSKIYEKLINECRQLNKGSNHPLFGTKRSEESKLNQIAAVKGKKQTIEHIQKRVNSSLATRAKNKELGVSYSLSDSTKDKLSKALKGRNYKMTETHKNNLVCHKNNTTKIECPHCQKVGQLTNMKRWHLDNCKSNPNRKERIEKTVICAVCGLITKQSPNFYRYHNNNCKTQIHNP